MRCTEVPDRARSRDQTRYILVHEITTEFISGEVVCTRMLVSNAWMGRSQKRELLNPTTKIAVLIE